MERRGFVAYLLRLSRPPRTNAANAGKIGKKRVKWGQHGVGDDDEDEDIVVLTPAAAGGTVGECHLWIFDEAEMMKDGRNLVGVQPNDSFMVSKNDGWSHNSVYTCTCAFRSVSGRSKRKVNGKVNGKAASPVKAAREPVKPRTVRRKAEGTSERPRHTSPLLRQVRKEAAVLLLQAEKFEITHT